MTDENEQREHPAKTAKPEGDDAAGPTPGGDPDATGAKGLGENATQAADAQDPRGGTVAVDEEVQRDDEGRAARDAVAARRDEKRRRPAR